MNPHISSRIERALSAREHANDGEYVLSRSEGEGEKEMLHLRQMSRTLLGSTRRQHSVRRQI